MRGVRPGFGPEFMNRPDGYPGLVRAYGLTFSDAPREMDRNLLYQVLAKGSIDVAAGDSTDGRIAALDLVRPRRRPPLFPPVRGRAAGAGRDAQATPQAPRRVRPPFGPDRRCHDAVAQPRSRRPASRRRGGRENSSNRSGCFDNRASVRGHGFAGDLRHVVPLRRVEEDGEECRREEGEAGRHEKELRVIDGLNRPLADPGGRREDVLAEPVPEEAAEERAETQDEQVE